MVNDVEKKPNTVSTHKIYTTLFRRKAIHIAMPDPEQRETKNELVLVTDSNGYFTFSDFLTARG